MLTHAGQTRSVRAWAAELGIDRRTLAYRLHHGWPVDQVLGFAPHRRDHAAEQARSPVAQSHVKVQVVDADGRVIPRAEAAARLGVKTRSLIHRLRQYRHPDGSPGAQVPLAMLDRR
jgi:hypothetical protein